MNNLQAKISLPSFKRFKWLVAAKSSISLTRLLQYEILMNCGNLGEVLDFGGGDKSHYRPLIDCNSYSSINIDIKMEPTWLINAGDPIPCKKKKFDTVISFNTIEHIFEPAALISELYHSIKSGGSLLITTPFLFPIHAHPDDFFRPTPSWYQKTLSSCGFHSIECVPLAWGPFSSGSIVSGMPGPLKKLRFVIILLLDLIYFYLSSLKTRNFNYNKKLEKFATAFFVRAIK